jgi:hypothetical protein
MNTLTEAALNSVIQAEAAYCKFLAPNDTKQTGSHQAGFLISVDAGRRWLEPVSAGIAERPVTIHWHTVYQHVTTHSQLKYYASKREYRFTQFGRNFPFREAHLAGSLFLCVPVNGNTFDIYLADHSELIEEILASLLVSPTDLPTVWTKHVFDPNPYISRFIHTLNDVFPSTAIMAQIGRDIAYTTNPTLHHETWSTQLLEWIRMEYQVFRAVERHFFLQEDPAQWADVDKFLAISNSMMNRRKARAGKSLEHHVAALFNHIGVPFTAQAATEGGHVADFLMPGKSAYDDLRFPANHLTFLAAKTTCKDRWRQILTEANRIPVKHLITLQPTLSREQLTQMRDSQVELVVPEPYLGDYPTVRGAVVWTVDKFMKKLQNQYGSTSSVLD